MFYISDDFLRQFQDILKVRYLEKVAYQIYVFFIVGHYFQKYELVLLLFE